ncbi:MAG: di-trans,poly-cis-decaprenylcistransferase [Burkholderiales bacterium]|jgi:undecaprenyl diphosphate synthase|nr:di-trans,poly-cis-decaprenylcistransferase [Burkholderiales bacterium]
MAFFSTTKIIPEVSDVPRHVAIIMDGNGRWAKQRLLPRFSGHQKGVATVRGLVAAAIERKIEFLTLFAFSSENWRRPAEEISLLKGLFLSALEQEIDKLHKNGIRLKVIGDISGFGRKIEALVAAGEKLTKDNQNLTLTIAASYGGRWDIFRAAQAYFRAHPNALSDEKLSPDVIDPYLSMPYAPEPDLFIRTGGEKRISNFLLWQLAYTELYFTETLWPDFDAAALDLAIASYRARERRFGRTSDQLRADTSPAS